MLLAIDTAGAELTLGLFDGDRPLAERREEAGRAMAERLVPAIRTLLAETGVEPSGLSAIAAVAGPGSFMGLRSGLAAARMMALGLGIEAVGVSRLRALAHGAGAVHVVLDARRGEVFEQPFAADGRPVRELRATAIGRFEPQGALLAGSGAALVRAAERAEGCRTLFDHDRLALAAVAALARYAPLAPRAIYGRGADAKPQRVAAIARSEGP